MKKTAHSGLCPLSEEKALTHTRFLKLLSDPTRLRILNLLGQHEEELGAGEIMAHFEVDQSNISHHLRLLRDGGLVEYRKEGLWTYYRLRREVLQSALSATHALIQSWITVVDPRRRTEKEHYGS